jgi:hypothetical protein
MNHNDIQKFISNTQNYITADSTGIKSVSWDNSAPTTMALYEYVEKNMPNSTNKGKIIITDEDEITDISEQIISDLDNTERNGEKTKEEKTFLQTALDTMSIIIDNLIFE